MTTVQAGVQPPAVNGIGIQQSQPTGALEKPKSEKKTDPIPGPQHKTTCFRPYTLHTMERRQYQRDSKARRDLVRVKYCPPRCQSRSNITVDSSKAKSNLDVLRLSLKELGWREYPYGRKDSPCDVYWLSVSFNELNSDIASGRVNKYPGMVDVLKKANLTRALDLMKRLYPEEYDFYPQTWYMPQQLNEFAADVRQFQSKNPKSKMTFIAKPDEGSQGEGIYLFRDPDEYMLSQRRMVVQEYLSKPFLLDKLKFDLRVYAVLTSIEPLEICICKEGLVRFCTISYHEPSYKNMHESYMHLTNYSLNKRSSTYVHTDNSNDGSKRTLTSVFTEIGRLGHNVDQVFKDIERVIVKTLIAVLPELRVEMNAEIQRRKATDLKCFQILGFDILLLDDLKPVLLEVNANPSLRIDYEHEVSPGVTEYYNSAVDEEIKQPLIRDTLLVIAPRNVKRKFKKIKRWRKARQNRRYGSVPPRLTSREGTMIEINHDDLENMMTLEKENIKKEKNTVDNVMEETKVEDTDDKIDNKKHKNDKKKDKEKEKVDKKKGKEKKEEKVDNESNDNETPRPRTVDGNNNPEEEDEDEEPSSIEQIYPQKYSEYEEMRIYDRVANIFLQSVGVRGSLRMGGSGFRVFTRRCKLTNTGFSTADMDLIFIEMTRKWEHCNPDRTAGLCFLGFIEAFYHIGRRKFYCRNRIEMLENLLQYCEQSIAEAQQEPMSGLPKLPKISGDERYINQMKKIYTTNRRVVRKGEFFYDFRGSSKSNPYKKDA
ncbi:tubulin polyglutamylase TTLL11-like isoform X2 [Lineus longissimus]|uniref:tubulin polyglutamylase TTLL11-like isoform X2 n=1 Tax=Lineus longissimus TaxID=88925 RepID=UPI00315DA1CF